ncbi:hypothetical protein ZWY2020_036529 [Hordeum vulgare]|nr:hypothetical protein ZWY2020_036529 [Hordeum vulgare]
MQSQSVDGTEPVTQEEDVPFQLLIEDQRKKRKLATLERKKAARLQKGSNASESGDFVEPMLESDNLVVHVKKRRLVFTPRKSPHLVRKVASPSLGELPGSGGEVADVTPWRSPRVLSFAKPSPPIGSVLSAKVKMCGIKRKGGPAKVSKGCKKRSRVDADGQDVVDEDSDDECVDQFDGVSVDSEKLANKHASDMGCFDGLDRTEHKFSTGDGVFDGEQRKSTRGDTIINAPSPDKVSTEGDVELGSTQAVPLNPLTTEPSVVAGVCSSSRATAAEPVVVLISESPCTTGTTEDDNTEKILSGQVDRRVRKFFKATQPESMDAHKSVILPTFDPPDTPAHMGGVGHSVSVFLDLKNERFQLLDSYYGPTDETTVHLCWKMIDNIKKLWSDVSNDRETPINPLSIDHFPLDRIDVPQQHNNVDYGFFMLTNVNSFHQGVVANYTHEDISDIRKTWLYAISTSNLFEKDFMELFGYHTWSAAPKTHCTQKVFVVQAEEISSDSDFEKIVGMRKSGKSAGATVDGRGGKNGVIARRKPTLESRNITSAKRVERLPLKWCSHSPVVDDWKAEFMYNLVFNPKNEILHEELPAEIRELAQ